VRQTKAGRTTCGSQRYHCHACGKLYSPFPKEQGYPPETRQMALKLYLEGNGLRRIARLLGCHPQSVANWINAYQASLQAQTPQLPVPMTVETAELDELYTFIGAKKTVGST
jgi:transposase-like protein